MNVDLPSNMETAHRVADHDAYKFHASNMAILISGAEAVDSLQ